MHSGALLVPILGGVSSAPRPVALEETLGTPRVRPSSSGCRGGWPTGALIWGLPDSTHLTCPGLGSECQEGLQHHVVCIFKVPKKSWKGSPVTVTMLDVFMWKVEAPFWIVCWKLPGISSWVSPSSSPPCCCLAQPTRGHHTREGLSRWWLYLLWVHCRLCGRGC